MVKNYLSRLLFLFAFIGMTLGGCSDQPNQRLNKGQIIPNLNSPSGPVKIGSVGEGTLSSSSRASGAFIIDNVFGRTPTEIRPPRVSGENKEDDVIELNGKQPIVFNGVTPSQNTIAGIKFNMTYGEAEAILSTGYPEGCGDYYGDYYLENLCMKWSSEEPRRLLRVLVLDGYLGKIEFPAPIGSVSMKAELGTVFTPDMGELGEELLKKTYNKFFKEEEAYDCLETKKCQATVYNQYINWIMPNITVVFSKDRKVLVQMIMDQEVQPGDFASPLDLALAQINVESTGKILKLGETWGSVLSKLSSERATPTLLETTAFRKDFVGMVARVDRKGIYSPKDFDLDAQEPTGDDIFNGFTVYSNYTAPIMINEKFVRVVQGSNEIQLKDGVPTWYEAGQVKVELVKNKPTSDEMLTVRMDKFGKNIEFQKSILTQLAALLKSEFESLSDKAIVSQRFTGLNAKQAPNRNMNVRTSYYDPATERGVFVYIGVGYNSASFVYSVSLDNDPLSPSVMATLSSPVDVTTTEVAGVELGAVVRIDQIDRARNEGFVSLDGKNLRAEINLRSSTSVSYEDGVTSLQQMVDFSIGGLFIGVAPRTEINEKTTSLEGEIIYISSSRNDRGITNLCDSDHVFKIGMTLNSFRNELRGVRRESFKKNKEVCQSFVKPDEAGDGEARVFYFPKQQVKVYFNERALAGIAKYQKPTAESDEKDGGNQ